MVLPNLKRLKLIIDLDFQLRNNCNDPACRQAIADCLEPLKVIPHVVVRIDTHLNFWPQEQEDRDQQLLEKCVRNVGLEMEKRKTGKPASWTEMSSWN